MKDHDPIQITNKVILQSHSTLYLWFNGNSQLSLISLQQLEWPLFAFLVDNLLGVRENGSQGNARLSKAMLSLVRPI